MIDSRGHAVALNAGSKSSSASAFFLPLDRIVRALEAIQESFNASDDGGGVQEAGMVAKRASSGDKDRGAVPAGSAAGGGHSPEGGVGGGSEGSRVLRSWKPPIVPRGTLQVGFCCLAAPVSYFRSRLSYLHDGGLLPNWESQSCIPPKCRVQTLPPPTFPDFPPFLASFTFLLSPQFPPPSPPLLIPQTTFIHRGFDETRRLGLQRCTEQEVRLAAGPSETGLLVVDSVVPGGPADGQLEPGDVLVRCNGQVTKRQGHDAMCVVCE